MMYKSLGILSMAILFIQCSAPKAGEFKIEERVPYGVNYSRIALEQLKEYEMVVIEPALYTEDELEEMASTGTEIIAYLSLGEVAPGRWYYPLLEERGFYGTNPIWNSYYLRLDDPQTRRIILNEVIPQIMAKRPQGLFLDTIDAVGPDTKLSALRPYMYELIRDIRARYPNIVIIQNAGLFLLDRTAPFVDAFMTESLASNYNFAERAYLIRSDSVYETRLQFLQEISGKTNTPYFILEYADSPENITKIRSRLDTLNRPYFISNIGLNKLPEDPSMVTNTRESLR